MREKEGEIWEIMELQGQENGRGGETKPKEGRKENDNKKGEMKKIEKVEKIQKKEIGEI